MLFYCRKINWGDRRPVSEWVSYDGQERRPLHGLGAWPGIFSLLVECTTQAELDRIMDGSVRIEQVDL